MGWAGSPAVFLGSSQTVRMLQMNNSKLPIEWGIVFLLMAPVLMAMPCFAYIAEFGAQATFRQASVYIWALVVCYYLFILPLSLIGYSLLVIKSRWIYVLAGAILLLAALLVTAAFYYANKGSIIFL